MTKSLILSLLGATLALVSGCTLASFETEPVTLKTDKGEVVCQLFDRHIVIFDRVIHMPYAMHVEEADALCRAESERLRNK
jgi:hypothetical protein